MKTSRRWWPDISSYTGFQLRMGRLDLLVANLADEKPSPVVG